MIAITRYRVPAEESDGFAEQMGAVLETLSGSQGYRSGLASPAPSTTPGCGRW